MANEEKKNGSRKGFFKGVRTEMKKVVWPTKNELVSYTIVVIVVCAVFALLFWAIDTGTLAGLRALFN